jgi:hypothetical protein
MEGIETIAQDDFTPEPEPETDEAVEIPDDDPVHLAKCAECATAVRFRPNVTGTGFVLVDADPDATFGVGEHGRPVCPNGHGEMSIADDQLKSATEAFTDAQGMLLRAEAEASSAPVQGDLPGIIPAFNFQGAYLELETKADAIAGVLFDVHPATIAEWTPEDRAAVRAWAGNDDAPFDQMPAVLGRPHVAGHAGDHAQACTECGAVLRTWNEGDGSIVWLSAGARVRTDCPGKQAEAEHHYPERKKKAPRAKAEKSAKPAKTAKQKGSR